MKLLLKACRYIITQDSDRNIVENKDILIEGNEIVGIGSYTENCRTINCSNKLVLPGLFNMHTHTITNILRGISDELKLKDWLEKKIFPAEAKIDDTYYGALLTGIESLKNGVTCVCDMGFMADRVVKAFEKTQLRGIIGKGMIDLFDRKAAIAKLKDTIRFVESVKDHPLIIPAIAPHAPNTCSEFLLKESAKLANKYNLINHMHILETKEEAEAVRQRTGKEVIPYLESIGFLDEHTLGVHMCWLKASDVNTLARHKCSGVHCPISNLKLASGSRMPLELLSLAGIKVALGTDSTASNNSLDILEEMKQVGLWHKYALNDATAMPAQQILDMATLIPAKIAGLKAGAIAKSMLADIITIPLNNARLVPHSTHNILSHLIYSCSGSDVADTIINGKLLMQNRKLLNLDEDSVLLSIQEYAKKLFS